MEAAFNQIVVHRQTSVAGITIKPGKYTVGKAFSGKRTLNRNDALALIVASKASPVNDTRNREDNPSQSLSTR